MDRVNPPTQIGYMLRSSAVTVEPQPLNSELGVFGVFVRYVERERETKTETETETDREMMTLLWWCNTLFIM